jgi:PilZ domain
MRADPRPNKQISERILSVQSERPRARRYPFVAGIEMTDVESETQTSEQTYDVSLFGCSVKTQNPMPPHTRISIRIVHAGASFAALGKVAYAGKRPRMGIAFTKIEPNQQLVLEKWIAELREMRDAKQVKARG